jgi:acyl-coenzyme A thioesterase PaaI-like protein
MSNPIRRLWDRWERRPGGKRIFSLVLGRMVPYTGSIRPRVEALAPGYARVVMHDRRAVRNHLSSVHAIALANLGEVASGLSMMYALPPEARGIVTAIEVQYLKKARGTLVAECRSGEPEWRTPSEHRVTAEIRDAAGDVVCRVTATWKLAPRDRA